VLGGVIRHCCCCWWDGDAFADDHDDDDDDDIGGKVPPFSILQEVTRHGNEREKNVFMFDVFAFCFSRSIQKGVMRAMISLTWTGRLKFDFFHFHFIPNEN